MFCNMFTGLRRISKSGVEKFSRDRTSSGAALLVMIIVLFIASSLFFANGITSFLITSLQESVDISTYLKNTATEEEILDLRERISRIPEVSSVVYISKNEALERFVETHKRDKVILESLDAVGQNPLLASLNITATDPSYYVEIAAFLENPNFASLVESVDFHDRIPVIERLTRLAGGIQTGALVVTLFSAGIAVLVAFNTIRLMIYNSKEEIEVMRLVGASNWFIRGPFIIQGIIAGVLATGIVLLLLFPITFFAGRQLEAVLAGFNLFDYFLSNFFVLLLLQFFVGTTLGVVSSMIAIKKYLKV